MEGGAEEHEISRSPSQSEYSVYTHGSRNYWWMGDRKQTTLADRISCCTNQAKSCVTGEPVIVLKIDMRNAFNLVSRQALLWCEKHFPKLFSWVSWCYGQHPLLWHSLGCLTSELGNKEFCSSFVSKSLENVAGLWSQLEEVSDWSSGFPNFALPLWCILQACSTRATPTSLTWDALAVFD